MVKSISWVALPSAHTTMPRKTRKERFAKDTSPPDIGHKQLD